ncbi:MAG: hypothetical protein IPP41_09530 [Rhodocyclaceae bacterium]|nr:hypothetical protein [Rhodocyclaceae bacterium]
MNTVSAWYFGVARVANYRQEDLSRAVAGRSGRGGSIDHCGICHSGLSMLDNEWG